VTQIEAHVHTAKIIKDKAGNQFVLVEKTPAILYHYEEGKVFKTPDSTFPIKQAVKVISNLHQYQLKKPLTLPHNFTLEDAYNMWLPLYVPYKDKFKDDKSLSGCFERLELIVRQAEKIFQKMADESSIPWLHNHGDVMPRNFIVSQDKAILIDFQNAFYAPRLVDIIDGAYEFSLASKQEKDIDFTRFNEFIKIYQSYVELTVLEKNRLDDMIKLCGVIKFLKEIRMMKENQSKTNIRRVRAIGIAQFLTQYL